MRLLGPTSLAITFQKISLKEVLQNTCVNLSLPGSYRDSEDTTSPYWPAWPPLGLPPHPCPWAQDPISAQPGAINPCSSDITTGQPQPSWIEVVWICWIHLGLLPCLHPMLTGLLIAPIAITMLPCSSPRCRGVHPVHKGIVQPAWWLLRLPHP